MQARETIFNLNALVSIRVYDRKIDNSWYWLPHKPGIFWGRDEVWRSKLRFVTGIYSDDGLFHFDNRYMIEGDKVYYRPKVVLQFANREEHVERFFTYEDALNWGRKQAELTMDIKLVL